MTMTTKKESKKSEDSETADKTTGAPTLQRQKVFDIAHPGKGSTPSATSRPMIVTHRTLTQDPMMVKDKTVDENDGSPVSAPVPIPKMSKLRIEPIHHEEDEHDDGEEAEDNGTDTESSRLNFAIPVLGEEKKTDTDDASEAGSKKTEEKPQEPVKADKESDTDGMSDDEIEEMNDFAMQAATKQAKKTEESEDEKRQKAAAKLVETKKYFVPINSTQRKKAAVFAWLFLVFSLCVAAAAGYFFFVS